MKHEPTEPAMGFLWRCNRCGVHDGGRHYPGQMHLVNPNYDELIAPNGFCGNWYLHDEQVQKKLI